MTNYKLILASQSPRRQELLSHLNIPFDVMVKEDVEETYPDDIPAHEVPLYLARKKALPYETDCKAGHILVITADTIVCCDEHILGKPADKKEAEKMLQMLSGRAHEVITGVALTSGSKQSVFTVSTKVFFKTLTPQEIDFYIEQYQPFDKAGAYGIQEWIGMIGIERIEGSYFNVVGLPVQKLYNELQKF
ncbi:septum formation protein Maf [Carboxylicivirga sediminis]|uniref:dTTP/UTP pyrophosphatase n=1 Tax=Carboxylicivirga sediminis TaxID=2006564 RepID=A0A941F5M0_9BACT|nr:Maf family nucleotide pyrophosphatase [Carboxylicivirga sediminis]MBR8536125.1 septum formation protein Maf [Carboxylicivirga sediminis]